VQQHAAGAFWATPWLTALLLLALALPFRILPPAAFVTVDEAYHWFDRTHRFLAALQDGAYAETNLVGHPGVTTLWLGACGVLAHGAAVERGWVPDSAAFERFFMRLPIALVTSCCIVLAYFLLRRLLAARVALLAALLWAGDPFLVTHSQFLHVDALLASFMSIALLAALVALRFDGWPPGVAPAPALRWWALLLSAVAGGMAFLTKSPSVFLLPMIGIVACISSISRASLNSAPHRRSRVRLLLRALSAAVRFTLLWCGIAALVWVALWPAAWVDTGGAVGRIIMQVRYEGAEPHAWGNFFMGQAVDDPGAGFYPVAVALRLTPWALVGLLAVVGWLVWALRKRGSIPEQQQQIALVGVLLGFVLLFMAGLSIAPKKFDRYMLPIFPALDILAAVGLVWSIERVSGIGHWGAGSGERRCTALVALALAGNLAWYSPYTIAYYNPLLGGGAVAARTIPVGWGEGLDVAGRYISRQFNGCDYPVASWFQPVLQPFTCTPVVPLPWVLEERRVDYVVLYIDQLQRQNRPQVTAMLHDRVSPVHTVRLHGIEYAQIYQLPPPIEQPRMADFGDAIRFQGYDVTSEMLRSSGVVTVTTHWQALAPIEEEYMLFLHVLDAEGNIVGHADAPPGGPRAPTSIWKPQQYITWFHPVPLPADTPAGTYWVSLGVYHAEDFTRLPLDSAQVPAAPTDGAHALLLGPLLLP
jgi:4-amino-4-deoxy-L-arabinose transferase-like glycosyltransferase